VSRLSRADPPADPLVRGGQAARTRRRATRAMGGLTLAAALGLAISGCSGGPIGQDTAQSNGQSFVSGSGTTVYPAGHRPAVPDISGTTLTGQKLSLSSYRGSIVVLNFWASWCGPCQAEAPGLAALASQLRSRGVRFLGDDVQDDPASAKAFMKSNQISYPSLNDPSEQIALAFHSTVTLASIPSTLVIDRTGHIAGRILGSVSYDGLRSLIARISGDHLTATASGASS
jgi:peroxiredoxin